MMEAKVMQEYQPGAILYNSWGYDQTNIDWYVIVKRSGQYVTLARLAAEETQNPQTMTGRTLPGAMVEGAKPIRRKLKCECGDPERPVGLQIQSYGWCQLWDGQPKSYSYYG